MTLYQADLSAGALMPAESRILATLLCTGVDKNAWTHAIKEENILQKKSPSSAIRQARLIRARLETLDDEGVALVAHASGELLNQMLLLAAVRHSRLLGDFLIDVYRCRLQRLENTLDPNDWTAFLHECEQRDREVSHWSESTRAKLRQVITLMLAEAHFIDSTKSLRLTPPLLHPVIRRYIQDRNDHYALEAMDVKR